ncbi:protein transport protein sec31-like isoform X2 [Miscanthus floridulus]|uniref:protein transport protein sec31-like isoform X2 n=1 Tax=Miscanthus floridulus TaxID=154761 RepID=UPI0034580AAF
MLLMMIATLCIHHPCEAGHAVVPKFGPWDAENIGYTVFFEKVRNNKAPPAPAPKPSAGGNGGYDFDPYEHYESLSRKVPSRPPSSHGHAQPAAAARAPAPVVAGAGYDLDPYEHYDSLSSRNVPSRPPGSHGHAPAAGYDYDFDPYEHYENLSARNVPSRPPSSHGHAPQPHPGHGYHRRTGSNGSNAASKASSRGSKFSPPRPYQPRYISNDNNNVSFPPQPQGGGHGAQYHHNHHHHHGAPRAASASPSPSPPRHHHPAPPLLPRRPKPSAVPRFGVWDEQNAAMAAQGFTVQFEKVKRHREEASRTAPAPPSVQPPTKLLAPDHAAAAPRARRHGKRKAERSFMSRMYRCLFPRVRE